MPAAISAFARKAPHAIAIEDGNVALSYRELLAGADALAERLRRLGVGPEVPVAICLDRSIDQIVATLGVMRAGGAFVPLDPHWPAARRRQILDDLDASLVITSAGLTEGLGPIATTSEAMVPPIEPLQGPQPEHLAYIIYTSGSTGAPKGAEIEHRNLARLTAWHHHSFQVTPADRASCLAGPGFDANVWEIWAHLSAGACVCLVDESVRTSPDRLREWLTEHAITIAFVPTPLAEPMIRAAWDRNAALRFLLTGGDALHVRPRPDLPFAVVNNYGLSECAVVSTSGIITASGDDDMLPAIGQPIMGTRIHVLDAQGRACPVGQVGEIYIGGDGVGRGYRNRPDLTAERFVADPAATEPGMRLFRTGDLGSWLPGGQIAFHGRGDNQLKIRGNRVEPNEIAQWLNRHPEVAQSAVLKRDKGGELVAYVVMRSGQDLRLPELRAFLASSLPDYMIPAQFIAIDALPLTANGKVDTAMLSALDLPVLRDVDYRAPHSPLEQRLTQLVSELLQVGDVGRDDNFFHLGGHSLLGMQLVTRVRENFGIDLLLRDLFQAPTVSALASTIERLAIEKLSAMKDEEALQAVGERPVVGDLT